MYESHVHLSWHTSGIKSVISRGENERKEESNRTMKRFLFHLWRDSVWIFDPSVNVVQSVYPMPIPEFLSHDPPTKSLFRPRQVPTLLTSLSLLVCQATPFQLLERFPSLIFCDPDTSTHTRTDLSHFLITKSQADLHQQHMWMHTATAGLFVM